MWASYMHCTHDRKIHFWGTEGDRTGWITFGEGTRKDFEVGTVSYVAVPNLPYEEGAQTLNLIEHPRKKFITPFYYGFIDGDHDLETISDKLLYLFYSIRLIRSVSRCGISLRMRLAIPTPIAQPGIGNM